MGKRVFILIILILFGTSAFSKEKFDASNGSFLEFGRYIETLEINDEEEEQPYSTDEEQNKFEEEAIYDVAKRYEENAVELKLNEFNDKSLYAINESRMFQLRINETQYNIEQNIKAENMIWDGSKAFTNAFYTDSRRLAPIPSVINSSVVTAKVSPSLYAKVGQANLYNANTPSALFIRTNESTYNTGSVISYSGSLFNMSVGSFSSSYNHASSGGAVIASKPLILPFNSGNVVFGGGCFQNEQAYDYKTTGGLFGEYTYKRLKFNAQIGQSSYSGSNLQETSLYFVPEFKLTKDLSFKTRFIRNITRQMMQDEIVLSYTPKKNPNNLTFEINASNHYTPDYSIKQRIKFTTSFKI